MVKANATDSLEAIRHGRKCILGCPAALSIEPCLWQEDEVGYYVTTCDHIFMSSSLKSEGGGPVETCPSCRGRMVVVPFQEGGSWE